MNPITITKVEKKDILELQHIGKVTFAETFSETNTVENMQKYLEESFAIEKLEKELSDKNSEFYFAKENDQVVGYLKVNFEGSQTEKQHENATEIERIYVLNAYHGKKVGQLLYEKALAIAQERKSNYIWLGVWEENPRAIRFYEKNGFVAFDKHIFVLGEDKQTDIMMKKDLSTGKE